MLLIYFHLTSAEFVGSISMATIQKGDNVKSTHPHVHSPPCPGWRGPVSPSGSDQLSENTKEQYLKSPQDQDWKANSTVRLSKLWGSKVNEHTRSQPGSNMANVLFGHQEPRLLASIQTAGMCSPFMYSWGLFCKEEETGHLLLKSNSEFTIQTFTNTPVERKPSAIQILPRVHACTHTHIHTCTHTLSKNTSSWTAYSCSYINKEMNHTETNSNAGVIRPDLALLMMGRESLYLGQTSAPTSTTCVLMQKQTKDTKMLCFPPSLACALSNTQWQVLRLWRGVGEAGAQKSHANQITALVFLIEKYITILSSPVSSAKLSVVLSSYNSPCQYTISRSDSCWKWHAELQGFHFHLIVGKKEMLQWENTSKESSGYSLKP